jgi:hypothetical protein
MADSTHQGLRTEEKSEGEMMHLLWGCRQRAELLRTLAAHALTGGQPLVAAALYQQVADLEEQALLLRKCMGLRADS